MGKDELCRDVVGIYPALEDDRTWLLAVDFDDEVGREMFLLSGKPVPLLELRLPWSVPDRVMGRTSGSFSLSLLQLPTPAGWAVDCSRRR